MVKFFSNENLFTANCVINRRNDQFIAQKGDSALFVCHIKYSQSMMLGVIAYISTHLYKRKRKSVYRGLYQPFEKACDTMVQENVSRWELSLPKGCSSKS